jgi:hypothetical protein
MYITQTNYTKISPTFLSPTVYNKSRFGGVVHRSQRDISSIRKVEIRDSDRKTIRITWEDNREIYDIEYTCDTKRDCVEIAAKILFLITPLQKK